MFLDAMRLHILSDIHLEFADYTIAKTDADLTVLAGDIHAKLKGIKWIRERLAHKRVLYVCGNHEFYGEKFPRLIDKIRIEANGSCICFLENEGVEIDGFFFYGGTLWTDMALHGNARVCAIEAEQRMNEYRRVRNSQKGYRKLRAVDTMAHHRKFLRGLKEFSKKIDNKRLVVISHHAPSSRSLHDCRSSNMLNCAYASRLDAFINDISPAVWIHGHIHHSVDYMIGKTRVLANPRGYRDSVNYDFVDACVIDI
jgi:Icc-related predicted phosphoesterase